MTLRRRLVALMAVLVAAGLGAFAGISYSLFRNDSYQQVDAQLRSALPALAHALPGTGGTGGTAAPTGGTATATCRSPGAAPSSSPTSVSPSPSSPSSDGHPDGGGDGGGSPFAGGDLAGPPGDAQHNLPAGGFVALIGPSGALEDAYGVPLLGSDRCDVPVLPANLSATSGERFLTTASRSGDTAFRVMVAPASAVSPAGAAAGGVVVAAIPLTGTSTSLHDLVVLYVAVGLAVLVALSAAGMLVIRQGLRPLERMAATASAVADGDLSRRAEPADRHTEVGQLGLALNTMLVRIEQAFAARDATEARLRRFLADASHELRTPLTAIRGYTELYRLGAVPPEELPGVLARVEDNARAMGQLVEELLLLAHLDQTRPADREPVDLVRMVTEACADLAAAGPDRQVDLEAPAPLVVPGDAGHLRRAVTNILGNAARHTPGGTAIDVRIAEEDGAAVVRVRDHGPGFPPEAAERAFDRFWRADPSSEGSGLGLAIVAAVAAEHDGTARIRNAPDGGAVVELRLPLTAGGAPAGEPRTLPGAPDRLDR